MTNEDEQLGAEEQDGPDGQDDRDGQVLGGVVDMASFDEYLRGREQAEEDKYSKVATDPEYSKLLEEALQLFNDREEFKCGELVQWKPMMRNKKIPLDAVPAIVIDNIDPPLTTDFDGDRLMEPLDLLIAVVDGDKQFRLAEVSSRRFTAWRP